ncbi:Bardet-Biedl syndrome 5 protein homolog isoform X2 [Varroa destructor]|uniref:BBSome complex member BBS5 PH domain-containing protein n=1 Tax=Varroa destructor TaxID=109461 RepID=A0A7M7K930_VARDE|nr:Bardet-Biedl syndrome 5 protein homolog isoform X2 [Varroa destructor]
MTSSTFSLFELAFGSVEQLLDKLESVEDTKGNPGERGKIFISNMRLIWQSHTKPRVNLTVGWACVTGISSRSVNSALKGLTEALYLMTRLNNTRFEFIFTNLMSGTPRLVASVLNVYKTYNATRLYRELKLRSAIIHNRALKVLQLERIISKINGVWNLSSDQGNLGTFYVTNVRIVWHANLNENFNVSLPYIQVASLRSRESKFGMALVIETTEWSGGYLLGFKIDPPEKLKEVLKELRSVCKVHREKPIWGVDETTLQTTQKATMELINEEGSIGMPTLIEDDEVSQQDIPPDLLAAYYVDGGLEEDRQIVYAEELGLAVEALTEGYTLKSLWEVIPS